MVEKDEGMARVQSLVFAGKGQGKRASQLEWLELVVLLWPLQCLRQILAYPPQFLLFRKYVAWGFLQIPEWLASKGPMNAVISTRERQRRAGELREMQ